ncbi:MAG: hypothetical protein K0U84_10505 [Actinomycetia bacterium]|nr:hypothetical protein [Actinomycetes bacterium]
MVVMALITTSILTQHLHFAINAPAAVTGGAPAAAAVYVNKLGFSGTTFTAGQIESAARDVGEESVVSRTGGAPTLAIGMTEVLSVCGGSGLKAPSALAGHTTVRRASAVKVG